MGTLFHYVLRLNIHSFMLTRMHFINNAILDSNYFSAENPRGRREELARFCDDLNPTADREVSRQ